VNRSILLSLVTFATLVLATGIAAAGPEPRAGEKNEPGGEWVQDSVARGITIYSRTREGSGIKEFKSVGIIDAPASAVFAVIDDSEAYPTFMPYTAEVRVLKRDKDSVIAYQRLELPLVSDRDYTLRSRFQKWLGSDGAIYRIRWEPANDLGPPEKAGVLRVNVCEGGWLLEPDGDGGTRATYSIYTDSGGTIPTFLANNGSRIAIRKVFEAIRKQVKDPRYHADKIEARNVSAH
jgi:polyketide cyclase/dehydrase/lipid transport protein